MRDEPFVSVVTPVYNEEAFLAECIESVLNQTYKNFEYIIVNNCSTDRTLEIALHYAKQDDRIRVHTNHDFVGVMENHNIALSLISPEAKYCKVVCGDDFIFPDCLLRMVELAEANPTVGLVGSYSLAGKALTCVGLEYERKVVSGSEISRATLRDGPYVFGSPTSLIYRADLVRKSKAFYPNSSPHSDMAACYLLLEHSDFGFVHQVLSYTRIHAGSQTSRSMKFGTIYLALLADLVRFGPKYLSPFDLKRRFNYFTDKYYRALVPFLFERPGDKEFWARQKGALQEIGLQLSIAKLVKAAFLRGSEWLLKPGTAIKRILELRRNPGKIEEGYYSNYDGRQ